MRKTAIEKLAKEIGHDIGLADDVVQSDLLNGLCHSLIYSIQQESALDNQLCSISERLDPSSDKIIMQLAEFIELKLVNRKHEKARKGNP